MSWSLRQDNLDWQTINYAGEYAAPFEVPGGMVAQVALQVRVKPGSYRKQRSTLGLRATPYDDQFPNSEVALPPLISSFES